VAEAKSSRVAVKAFIIEVRLQPQLQPAKVIEKAAAAKWAKSRDGGA